MTCVHIASLVKNSPANQLHLHLGQELLLSAVLLCILGVTITHDLSWDAHYDKVRKVSSMTVTIFQFGRTIPL